MNGFEQRALLKKQQVIDSTFKLLNTSKKENNITINDIVKESNVGKTTIFKYFNNKENLIKEVYFYFLDEIRYSAKSIIEEDLSFEDTIYALSKNKLSFLQNVTNEFYLDLMLYFTTNNNDLLEAYTNESMQMMLDIFHKGRKEGKVDLKYSDQFLMLYFSAMIEGVSSPMIYENIVPYLSDWTEVLIKGLAPNDK
ncbi:MAG: TetR/AcrR family transcriptional regulator [Erysipelotrichales bacterium]